MPRHDSTQEKPTSAHPPPPPDLVKGLQRSPKYLPCRFLYDDRGSQLYEQITGLPEYLPYRAEQRLLQQHAAAIAAHMPHGSVVVELGCGDGSKTAILLEAVMAARAGSGVDNEACKVRYCGVDCSAEALRQMQRNLSRLLPELPLEQVELYAEEYLAGVAAVRARHPHALLTLLWLGSSVGNFSGGEAAGFLAELRRAAGEHSQLLLCTDLWKDEGLLRRAYNDSQGVSEAFIINGMHHALATLGHHQAYNPDLWQYEVVVNKELKQVEMYVRAQQRVADVLPGLHVEEGERVLVEISRKFTPDLVAGMALEAGFCLGAAWGNQGYRMQMLLTPTLALQRCWADTDSLYSNILDWQAQPIGLRNPFCFYYGHMAAFSRLTMLPQDAASELESMLRRGIDPLVHDPTQCHSHPPVPPSWPSRQQLLTYAAGVRQQVLAAARQGVHVSRAGNGSGNGSLGLDTRALWMSLEHERQHQETLCYMLAQQRKADAAAAANGRPTVLVAATSDGSSGNGARLTTQDSSSNGVLQEGGATEEVLPYYLQQCSYLDAAVVLPGASPSSPTAQHASTKNGAAGTQFLGPSTPAKASEAASRRIWAPRCGSQPPTMQHTAPSNSSLSPTPAGFVQIAGGEVAIGVDPAGNHGFLWDCEMGCLGPLPVSSLLMAEGPVTVAQFRTFVFEERGYQRPELWKAEAYRHLQASGRSLPATWSLLPPSSSPGGSPAEQRLWVHMPEGSYSWEQVAGSPVYVSQAEAEAYCRLHGGRLMSEAEWELAARSDAAEAGALCQLETGGWEWTCSLLEPLPGFQVDPLYPEYSTDFFDGQHYVLRGVSPYTHPSMARRSFRNWYQALYPYVFAKFRLVRDAE